MISFHPGKTVFFRRCIAIVLIGLVCGGIMIILLSTGLLRGIELKSLDFRFLCRGTIPTNDKIVIIGTDEEALDKITPEKEITLRGKTQPIKLYRVET